MTPDPESVVTVHAQAGQTLIRRLAISAGFAVVLLSLLPATPGHAEEPTAPVTTLSSDGTTVTDGRRVLRASKVTGLNPNGDTVRVEGSGYDTYKGIYVTFCVLPPYNQPPSPCGGGPSNDGGGSSNWISSNPPPYGVGVAVPYGPGGSFSVTVTLRAVFGAVDCRVVRCAIVSRNDHTRSSDRSQDLFLPVTFAAAPITTPPALTPAPIPPPTSASSNPAATVPAAPAAPPSGADETVGAPAATASFDPATASAQPGEPSVQAQPSSSLQDASDQATSSVGSPDDTLPEDMQAAMELQDEPRSGISIVPVAAVGGVVSSGLLAGILAVRRLRNRETQP
ncbi:MAG: hypothetical protein N2037_04180 [Acidimicrobiales bacterium]|nr:hypothetical protein [Acidimicrobiales bacterium]